jgi:hypothetical protein
MKWCISGGCGYHRYRYVNEVGGQVKRDKPKLTEHKNIVSE